MKNIKLVALAVVSLLAFGVNRGYCAELSVDDHDAQKSISCSTACTHLQEIYNDALNFFDSGKSTELQAKLDWLLAIKLEADSYNPHDLEIFINAVKNIIAAKDKELSQEQKDDLKSQLKNAYTPIEQELCK